MKWNILSQDSSDIIKTLLKNRKIKNRNNFLNPPIPKFKLINTAKAIGRVRKAIKNQEKIVVYGDYDVDGICATAIVWETLNSLGAKALPFIPKRENEGYGLSIAGIDNIDASLVITVDSGIVAHQAVDYANKKNIDVIILDHHEKPKKLPNAYAIIHTTELCAAGIAYFFAQSVCHSGGRRPIESAKKDPIASLQDDTGTLELACIATVADMMPLTGINRSIVKYGLEKINKTNRPGLKALFEVAGIKTIGTYEIGYLIGPRLNAAGRIDSALTALRLLCTHSHDKALDWAKELNELNKERQGMVEKALLNTKYESLDTKIIVVDDPNYHQGIIGLIAGKLTEKHYLPSVVISRGEETSKASARSIAGFNVIEAIRTFEKYLINAGGHPMAAGFTIKTSEISNFKFQISNYANKKISGDLLEKTLKIDAKIDLKDVEYSLFTALCSLAPFGLGNPEPVFCSNAEVLSIRTMGTTGQHLKLVVKNYPGARRAIGSSNDGNDAIASLQHDSSVEAVMFNANQLAIKLTPGDKISLAYTIDLNTFNGKTNLQLKIKDIKIPHGGTN